MAMLTNLKFEILNLKIIKDSISNSKAFTLIELLVAISILAVVGTLLIVDFGPFREERSLQIVSANVQNFVRLAQINATSGVLCNNVSGASWTVSFTTDSKTVNMTCKTNDPQVAAFPSRTLMLEQEVKINSLVVLDKIDEGETQVSASDTDPCSNLQITFSPILGKVTFSSTDNVLTCPVELAQYAGIVLNKNTDKKFVIINKGGVIYVE